jgi:hypothetical protein
MIWLITDALIVLGAGLHIARDKQARTGRRVVEICLLYMLAIGAGVSSLLAFGAHAFFPDITARQIGWPTGSPFQFEVAMANLAFGVLGILCIWLRNSFWVATIIGFSIFWLGDAYGHFYQLFVYKDYAPYNAGFILYNDTFFPLVLLGLLVAYIVLGRRATPAEVAWE